MFMTAWTFVENDFIFGGITLICFIVGVYLLLFTFIKTWRARNKPYQITLAQVIYMKQHRTYSEVKGGYVTRNIARITYTVNNKHYYGDICLSSRQEIGEAKRTKAIKIFVNSTNPSDVLSFQDYLFTTSYKAKLPLIIVVGLFWATCILFMYVHTMEQGLPWTR